MKTIKGEQLNKMYEYEFMYWKDTSGFDPVELIATHDNAGSYEMSAMHVFKLKRGYAIVHERGCSCYRSSDACIDILETKDDVKQSLKNIAKENRNSYGDLAKSVLVEMFI